MIFPIKVPFDVDIIGTIFILLSRYEEHVLNRESHFDKFGRFKAARYPFIKSTYCGRAN